MLSFNQLAVTVAEADAYATLRGQADWLAQEDDVVKTAALRRSQDFLAVTYNSRWNSVWPNAEAPDDIKYAIIEGAFRELRAPNSLSPDVTLATARKRVKVEGAVEVEYAVGSGKISASDMRPDIPIIEGLLAPYLRVSYGGSSVDVLRF